MKAAPDSCGLVAISGADLLEQVQSLVEQSRGLLVRADIELALKSISEEFGFRSAVLVEYGPGLKSVSDVVDSDPVRRPKWSRGLDPRAIRGCIELTTALSLRAPVSEYDASYYADDAICRRAAEELDVLEGVAVPILQHSGLSGVVKFSGRPAVSKGGMLVLYTAAHLMFSAMQKTRHSDGKVVRLTPREKQVMDLTAQGHTTPETASILGMSERTVNQHTDNVASKLGTRNRVHTVANLVRLNMV